jgi:HSP20 family protein
MNNLIRFNPFSEVARFDPITDFDEMFDRFARTAMRPATWRELEAAEPQICMDIMEADGAYVVKAEIPGVKKDDIHVSIDGRTVFISAEVKHEHETTEGRLLRSERSFGKAMRSFKLEHEVIEDKVEAKYTDGVLELKLPMRDTSLHREIDIM